MNRTVRDIHIHLAVTCTGADGCGTARWATPKERAAYNRGERVLDYCPECGQPDRLYEWLTPVEFDRLNGHL